MDKHMFNKKDGSGRAVYSPEMFVKYDMDRGVERTQLHQLISEIWPGLEKSDNGKGYYWGDLLFSQPLQAQRDGLYHFRANPNGISYTVDPKSEIGKELTGKQAGIVVHQFIPPTAMTTDEATPLNGTIGNLQNNSNVAIVPAKMPITPNVKIDNGLVRNAQTAIRKYGKSVDQLMSTAPQAASAFQSLFTTYINKKIVSRDLNNLVEKTPIKIEQLLGSSIKPMPWDSTNAEQLITSVSDTTPVITSSLALPGSNTKVIAVSVSNPEVEVNGRVVAP